MRGGISANTLSLLAEAGLDMTKIAAIVQAIEEDYGPARSASAERQRRYRQRQKEESVTNDVTRYAHGDVTTPSPLTPPLKDPQTPKITPPISPQPSPPAPNGNGKAGVSEEHVLEAWNVMADQTGVHKARMTDERRRKLKIFVKRHTIDDITEAIWAVPKSAFLCGENDRGWKAGLDFLLQPSSFTKLIEGTYDGSTH